jgi:hypothetical protein
LPRAINLEERPFEIHWPLARLLQLLRADAQYSLPDIVRDDMTNFVAALDAADDFDPKSFTMNMTRAAVVGRLKGACGP